MIIDPQIGRAPDLIGTLLACPDCRAPIRSRAASVACTNAACGREFLIRAGIYDMMARLLPSWQAGHQDAFHRAEEAYAAACGTPLDASLQGAWGDVDGCTRGYSRFVADYCQQLRLAVAIRSDSGVIVDVSAGAGAYLRAVAPEFQIAIHMEAHAPSLQVACVRAKQEGIHNILFLRGSYLSPPIHETAADVVLCTDTLERTEAHDLLLLKAIHRSLAANGIAVIDTHARTWARRARAVGPTRQYSEAEFCQLLQQAGFSIIHVDPAGYMPSTLDAPEWALSVASSGAKLLRRPARWLATVRKQITQRPS